MHAALCRYQELLGALHNPAAAAALRARYPIQASLAGARLASRESIGWPHHMQHQNCSTVLLTNCASHIILVAPTLQTTALQLTDFVHTASSALPCLLLVRARQLI